MGDDGARGRFVFFQGEFGRRDLGRVVAHRVDRHRDHLRDFPIAVGDADFDEVDVIVRDSAEVRRVFKVRGNLECQFTGILGDDELPVVRAVAARQAGTLGPRLFRTVPRAIRAAKRVRTETAVGRGQVSVPSVAVDLTKQIFGELRDRTAVLIGSGEMANTVARLLTTEHSRLLVVGRDETRVSEITAKIDGSRVVVFGGESMNTTVSGVMANYLAMNNLDDFQLGDGLTQSDLDTSARVAVMGAGVASDLFGTEFPIGEQIRINGVSYEVVGILEESGGGLAGFTDDTVYVPLTTAQSRLYTDRTRSGEKIVTSITAQAASSEQVESAINDVTRVLRERHGITYGDDDDFQIFDQSSLLDTVNTVVGSLTAFLGAIAAISLLVGGIGIMNIMLVSVTERTREIGIRKAIGALRRDILTQFLLESMVLSLLGGVIGIILGWGISMLASAVFDLTMAVDIGTILLSASFAAAVGLIFGIYPAWRASNLRPIEALRYE